MALDLPDILDYTSGFKRPLRKGWLLSQSETHLFGYGKVTNTTEENTIHFTSSCLTSKLTEKPHTVDVIKKTSNNGEVDLKGMCSCKSNTGRCKHVVGFMLKLEKMPLSEVPTLSKTDVPKKWGKSLQSEVQKRMCDAQRPCRFLNLCHVKEKASKYKPFPSNLPEQVNRFVFTDILEAFPRSIAYKSIKSLDKPVSEVEKFNNALPMSCIIQTIFEGTSVIRDCVDMFLLYARIQTEINFYYDRVAITKDVAEDICNQTRFQNSPYWKAQRQLRITASSAYALYTYRKNRDPKWEDKINSIIFRTCRGNQHTEFGKTKEEAAKDLYLKKNNRTLCYVGLIIQPQFSWLGFSPDGFTVDNNGELILVEIKSLKIKKKFTGLEFCRQLKKYLIVDENNVVSLKKNCTFYGQIQLGLALTNLRRCKLLLWVELDKSLIEVYVNIDVVFVNDLVRSLTETYFNFYLPFLCNNKEKLLKE